MRHFNITYTGYFNRRHRRVGHLYQGRYKSILVDKEEYLSVLSRYVHLNPVRVRAMAKRSIAERKKYLITYPWSSLPGYLDNKKRSAYVDYATVLAEYGGDTDQGRNAYKKQLHNDLSNGIDLTDCRIISTIIGNERFVRWVRERFLKAATRREQLPVAMIHRFCSRDAILALIEKETGKDIESIKKTKGDLRRITMELLSRYGGLKGPEIGIIFGADYSSVSQERKRLRERIAKEGELAVLFCNFERALSTLKL